MSELLRIIPQEHAKGMLVPTRGTKVVTPAGEEIYGVTGITMRADINDVWRAEISCLVDPPELNALETSASDGKKFKGLSAQELARLRELEIERANLLEQQFASDHALIDFRALYS